MKRILFFLLLIGGYVTDSYGQAQVKKGGNCIGLYLFRTSGK